MVLKKLLNFGSRRFYSSAQLVDHLKETGYIESERVEMVMRSVDMACFVPSNTPFDYIYQDTYLNLDHNSNISAPSVHALSLELLASYLRPVAKVLDVGSGSGYLTAAVAVLVGESGSVTGVKHIPDIVTRSVEKIRKSIACDLLDKGCINMKVASR